MNADPALPADPAQGVDEFETLVAATLRINSTEDLESMCRNILTGACEVLRSEAASIMLIDEPSGNLKWFSVLGEAGDMLVNQDLSPGEGVAGWVAQSGQSVVTNDAANDARFCGRIDALSGFVTRSLLCVPLLAHGRILGVLEFINHPAGHPYGDYEVRKAQAFASLSAVALENSRLIRVAEEIGNVREIGRFKNEMVTVVAQEVRNPLTSVLGFAALLTQEETETDRLREFALKIRDEAARMDGLLESFLYLSRVESGQIALREEIIDLADLLERARKRHATAAHEIRLVLPEENARPRVVGDTERVGQIVDNLLGNAVKYSPLGGPVTIRVAARGGDWRVTVTDRGLGIPAECTSRLFHHFYRIPNATHIQQPGAGLGLTLVKALVEKMNGRLGVESDAERGTTFWFTLPAA